MSEIKKYAMSAIVATGLVLGGCVRDRETSFTKCDYDSRTQTSGEDGLYLRENKTGTNYILPIGDNEFLRNTKSGELEWRVNGVLQEMFPEDEIIVFDPMTERTEDLHFKHEPAYIRVDIVAECNSALPLTPVKNH